MDDFKPRPMPGWQLQNEHGRSLCSHFMPTAGHHSMSNGCWCKPFVQNEKSYTVVMHNLLLVPDHSWPFDSQHAGGTDA